MANEARQLAEITKIILDTAVTLGQRGSELLGYVIDALPPTGSEPPPEADPLTIDVSEDTTDTTRMSALLVWNNTGTGNHVTIDWGAPDAVDDDEPPTGTKSYQYPSPGTFPVAVTDLIEGTRTVTVDVTVPFTATGV